MIRRLTTYLSSLLLVVPLAGGCITYTATQSVQMELPAIHNGEKIIKYSVDDYGTQKTVYTVSYDITNKQPFWVAYDLTAVELAGENSRKGKNFRPDENAHVPQATYSGPWSAISSSQE